MGIKTQEQLLSSFCTARGWSYEVISDLGSGMNYRKKGLKRILDAILERKIKRLVITHKDRLLRFGAELIFSLCEARNVEVVIMNQGDECSFEEELAKDVLEIIIADMGFFEFKRQLKYKGELRGNNILEADPWFASSKTCSSCGKLKQDLSLAERTYHCSYCDFELDRNWNAALCLEQLLNTVSSTGINACGQDGSVNVHSLSQPAWQKQELSPV